MGVTTDALLRILETQVFKYILRLLDRQTDSYNTTLQEDELILTQSIDCASMYRDGMIPQDWCDVNAIRSMLGIRIGEKRVLNGLMYWFSTNYPEYNKDELQIMQ